MMSRFWYTASAVPRYHCSSLTRCCAGSRSTDSFSSLRMKLQPRWMWRSSEWLLYCVTTAMRRMPEFRQFDSAKSMMRNLPPKCTAGLARRSVSCISREPRPPASTSAKVRRPSCMASRPVSLPMLVSSLCSAMLRSPRWAPRGRCAARCGRARGRRRSAAPVPSAWRCPAAPGRPRTSRGRRAASRLRCRCPTGGRRCASRPRRRCARPACSISSRRPGRCRRSRRPARRAARRAVGQRAPATARAVGPSASPRPRCPPPRSRDASSSCGRSAPNARAPATRPNRRAPRAR
mmetsp:Transcript_44682/g.105121  ORF Transcript_44682/g.105121 Transcript_44682/m.105121 type:complete len:292 (+) Transcript_44682:1454-2329(+)